MTALKEYERLECTGLWKENIDSQRREVLVSFGDNSLILRDTTEQRFHTGRYQLLKELTMENSQQYISPAQMR